MLYSRGEYTNRGAAIVRFELLFNLRCVTSETCCCSANIIEYTTGGGDVIGWYFIYVRTVLLIMFEGFLSILMFVGFSLPVVATVLLYFGGLY